MKFTLVWKNCEKATEFIREWLKCGKDSEGIRLVRVEDVDIVDKITGTVTGSGYALRCNGSILNYLSYKRTNGNHSAMLGWGYPK